jgi:hypothetical protein
MMEETGTERQGMKHVVEEELGEEEDDASSTNQSVLSSRSHYSLMCLWMLYKY